MAAADDVRPHTRCRLCAGALRPALDLGDTPLANELNDTPNPEQDVFQLCVMTCVECGHAQLSHVVNPERLFRHYVYQSGTSPVFVQHLKDFARDVKPAREKAFVVEIGSNDGTLLAEYQDQGHEVLGIDPASNIADIAEDRGVPTLRCFFGPETLLNWSLNGRKADLVLALNVFAHADDLAAIADGVAGLLAEDGLFVFEVGYLPDLIERRIFRTIYHEHTSYHHLQPLLPFFAKRGLHVVDAHRVQTQGGSVRVFVRRALTSSDRLIKILNYEASGLVWDCATRTWDSHFARLTLTPLVEAIARDKAELRVELDAARAAGKTVCGYGAPAQLTTTAYALGLTAEDIAFVVDDNPLKQGKYTPGLNWPILPPIALHKADVCVIFSANFTSDIINRHPDFQGEWVAL